MKAIRKPITPLCAVGPTPPTAIDLDARNALETKLVQLRSLLISMHGVGAPGFEDIGPGHRDNLIWLASDLACGIEELVDAGACDE